MKSRNVISNYNSSSSHNNCSINNLSRYFDFNLTTCTAPLALSFSSSSLAIFFLLSMAARSKLICALASLSSRSLRSCSCLEARASFLAFSAFSAVRFSPSYL